jgi:hypothetical protein
VTVDRIGGVKVKPSLQGLMMMEDECVSDAATSPITVSLTDSRCEEAIFICAAFDVDVARE